MSKLIVNWVNCKKYFFLCKNALIREQISLLIWSLILNPIFCPASFSTFVKSKWSVVVNMTFKTKKNLLWILHLNKSMILSIYLCKVYTIFNLTMNKIYVCNALCFMNKNFSTWVFTGWSGFLCSNIGRVTTNAGWPVYMVLVVQTWQ